MVRRNVEEPEELAYYAVFAPTETTTLEELVRVAGTRWRIESCFEQALVTASVLRSTRSGNGRGGTGT